MDIDSLQSLDGHAFEGLVVDLLRAMSLRVKRSKLSADRGIDAIAYCDEPLLKGKYVVQCKRQTAPVGEPVLRDLYGTVMSERAAKGILVTTSDFTQGARRFAQDKPIELISGSELIGLLQQKGLLDTVSSSKFVIPPQIEHLADELNHMLRPILKEIDDIEKEFLILHPEQDVDALDPWRHLLHPPLRSSRFLHPEQDVDAREYALNIRRTLDAFPSIIKSITNILNDLSRAAYEDCLEPAEMENKLRLMAKHVQTVKDSWDSSRRMRPPTGRESLHKAFVEFNLQALLSVCNFSEALQQSINSCKAGEQTAQVVKVVINLPDTARIEEELNPLEHQTKTGCGGDQPFADTDEREELNALEHQTKTGLLHASRIRGCLLAVVLLAVVLLALVVSSLLSIWQR